MSKASEKFNKVMKEWESGKLRDSHGALIKHPSEHKRALAVAFSEARKIDPKFKMDDASAPEKKEDGGVSNKEMGVDRKSEVKKSDTRPNKWVFTITWADSVGGEKVWRKYPNHVSEFFNTKHEAEDALAKELNRQDALDEKIELDKIIPIDIQLENGGKISFTHLVFRSHETWNPEADILVGNIDKDSQITYGIYVNGDKKGQEFMEYYTGENYVPGSSKKSFSKHYESNDIPEKYKAAWNELKEEYRKMMIDEIIPINIKMENGGKAGETDWDTAINNMFDAVSSMFVVERANDKDVLEKMYFISKKTAYKEALDEFAREAKKLKQDAAKKSILDVVKNIKAGKYKKEFRFTYGGKAGDVRKVSASSSLFDQFQQAYKYDKMENGGRTTGDIILKDEGDFFYIYGETKKGKDVMKAYGYKEGAAIDPADATRLINTGEADVETFKDGGKTPDSTKRDKMLEYLYGKPSSFDEVQLIDTSKLSDQDKYYVGGMEMYRLPDNYEPMDDFPADLNSKIEGNPFIGMKTKHVGLGGMKTPVTSTKYYYIDPQGHNYARYVGEIEWDKLENGGYMEAGGRVKTIKESDIQVGKKFTLINGDVVEIKRLFKENSDENWVEFTRSSIGKKEESSVNQLKNFINHWRSELKSNGGSMANGGKMPSWEYTAGMEYSPNQVLDLFREYAKKKYNRTLDEQEEIELMTEAKDQVEHGLDIDNILELLEIYFGSEPNGGSMENGGGLKQDVYINRYLVKLKHDTGTTSIIVVASNEESAKEKVLAAEGAPENAIISIRELKNKVKIKEDGGTTDDIEVVYERVSDFKKKPIRLLLLRRGNDERGYTFSGKEAVAVLNKYNRNKPEDLKLLWDLKGYESKYSDGGKTAFEDMPEIDLSDDITLPEGFDEQTIRMLPENAWKLKPGQTVIDILKNEMEFSGPYLENAIKIKKHFDNKDFVLGDSFDFTQDEKNVDKAKKYIKDFLKKHKEYKYVYNTWSEEPDENENQVIPLFSKFKIIGLNPKNQIKEVEVFKAPMKWEKSRDGVFVSKKGNLIFSLEKNDQGVYGQGKAYILFVRKKDDTNKSAIASFWTEADGGYGTWQTKSVDKKLWPDKYQWDVYAIKKRAQDILDAEGYFKDGGAIYSDGGETGEGKNSYKAFYKGREMDVKADTSYGAQKKAAELFKAKKSYEVTVMLTELGGEEYVHDTSSLENGGGVKMSKDKDKHAYYVKAWKDRNQYHNWQDPDYLSEKSINWDEAETLRDKLEEDYEIVGIYAKKDDREVSITLENGGTTENKSAINKNMESKNWMNIWYIEGSDSGEISNISTSIAEAQEALASHNEKLISKDGLGSIHKARVLKKDWDAKKVTPANLKKHLRDLAATGPIYEDGGTFDPEKKKLEDRIKALELSISSSSTSPEMRAQFQKALTKVQAQLRDYKAAPVQESSYERQESASPEVSVSTGSGTKVVVDVDPQSKLDSASKITVSVKAEGEKESAPAKREPEIKRTEIKLEPRSAGSATSAPSSGGNFYIDIVEKYSGAMRNVLYQEKKEENIKSYKIKTFDKIYRVFLESQHDIDLIFKIYNERREKKGDKPVVKSEVTGTSAKMKHGGRTKKFSPVKKRVEAKSVKKNLGHKGGSVKSKMKDGGDTEKKNDKNNIIRNQIKPGDTIYYQSLYDLREGKVVSNKGQKTVKIFDPMAKWERAIEYKKVALPNDSVVVVWEMWKGGEGGYRLERELYKDKRKQASNYPDQYMVTETSYGVLDKNSV